MQKLKLLFVAHKYHKKTHSCDFMFSYLSDFFDVDVFFDDAWKKNLDKYDRIVFWQNIPHRCELRRLKNKNAFWFPMADAVINTTSFRWRFYARYVKIINFSKNIHDKLAEIGIDSLYVQYFIKPSEFKAGAANKIFFWQRRNEIDINKVIAVLPDNKKLKIHMHTAIDPEQKLIMPTNAEIEKYGMTFSDWFDIKSDLINCIGEHGVYIAPRMFEGIGMGFLEALSMGKAIISNNTTTMNEYIIDGVNGYLTDFNNPKPVDLSNMAAVQKNAYDSAVAGYENWLNDRIKIIDFIKENSSRKKSNRHHFYMFPKTMHRIFMDRSGTLLYKFIKI